MLLGNPALNVFLRGLLSGDFLPLRGLIRRELAPERRTLDLGCGPGIFADLFAPTAYVGVDPNPRPIDHARRTRLGIYLEGELRRVPLPENRFDQVLIVERLSLLPDSEIADILAEVGRLLAGGGRALVVERVRGARGLVGRTRERWGRAPRPAEAYRHLLRGVGRVERWQTIQSGTARCLGVVLSKEAAGENFTGGRLTA